MKYKKSYFFIAVVTTTLNIQPMDAVFAFLKSCLDDRSQRYVDTTNRNSDKTKLHKNLKQKQTQSEPDLYNVAQELEESSHPKSTTVPLSIPRLSTEPQTPDEIPDPATMKITHDFLNSPSYRLFKLCQDTTQREPNRVIQAAQLFMQGADPNFTCNHLTLLRVAITHHQKELINLLLQKRVIPTNEDIEVAQFRKTLLEISLSENKATILRAACSTASTETISIQDPHQELEQENNKMTAIIDMLKASKVQIPRIDPREL